MTETPTVGDTVTAETQGPGPVRGVVADVINWPDGTVGYIIETAYGKQHYALLSELRMEEAADADPND